MTSSFHLELPVTFLRFNTEILALFSAKEMTLIVANWSCKNKQRNITTRPIVKRKKDDDEQTELQTLTAFYFTCDGFRKGINISHLIPAFLSATDAVFRDICNHYCMHVHQGQCLVLTVYSVSEMRCLKHIFGIKTAATFPHISLRAR